MHTHGYAHAQKKKKNSINSSNPNNEVIKEYTYNGKRKEKGNEWNTNVENGILGRSNYSNGKCQTEWQTKTKKLKSTNRIRRIHSVK